MVVVRNVTKCYGNGRRGVLCALHEASLHLAAGDFAVILGPSGAGKSTLLNVMGGMLRPSAGQVLVDGQAVWQLAGRARARLRAEKIGMVLQAAAVLPSLTVLENVLLPAGLAGRREGDARERAMELLRTVGLPEKARAFAGELSGGQKRRVAVASALMNDPPLLLADEPTGDLDERTAHRIMALIADRNAEGATVVVVTHDAELAARANRVFLIDGGVLYEDVLHEAAPGDRSRRVRRGG